MAPDQDLCSTRARLSAYQRRMVPTLRARVQAPVRDASFRRVNYGPLGHRTIHTANMCRDLGMQVNIKLSFPWESSSRSLDGASMSVEV